MNIIKQIISFIILSILSFLVFDICVTNFIHLYSIILPNIKCSHTLTIFITYIKYLFTILYIRLMYLWMTIKINEK